MFDPFSQQTGGQGYRPGTGRDARSSNAQGQIVTESRPMRPPVRPAPPSPSPAGVMNRAAWMEPRRGGGPG